MNREYSIARLMLDCMLNRIARAGLAEDELEVLAERVEGVLSGPDGQTREIPIAVLGKEDMNERTSLADVLAQMDERNSVLPDTPLQLRAPLVLLSGLTPLQLSAAIKAISNTGLSRICWNTHTHTQTHTHKS